MNTEEIKNKTIRSIVALTGRQMLAQIMSLLTLIPLGALLPPAAVGTFVAVTAITPFFNFFVDLGLGAALIQKKEEPTPDDLKTVFTVQLLLVCFLILVGLLLTGFLRDFSHLSPDGVNLYRVLLFVLLVSSLKSIPSVLMERHIKFERQVVPSLVEQFIYSVVVVFLAFKGFGVAAYSWAFGLSALAGLPIYYYLSPWPVALGISPDSFRRLFSYGFLYQSKTFLSLIKDNLLTIFLSGLPQIGTYGLGQIGWWQRWAYSPYNFVVASVTKVTFPTYARVQDDKEKLRAGIERSLFAVSLIMFPAAAAMIASAGKVVAMFPKYQSWAPGLPAFYFLCAAAAVSSLSGILVNILDSTGHVKTTSALMILWIILIWPLTIFLAGMLGFTGAAAASFLVSLTIFLTVYLVRRIVKFAFWSSFLGPLAAALVMGAVMVIISNLFLSLAAGAIIYAGTIWLLAREMLLDNARVVLAAFKK
jgi:O-antigen/teichoic acid export membrane protein